MTVRCTLQGDVEVIALDNPPLNSLGLDTRRELVAALEQAQADPDVAAIVLTGSGRAFSAGADLHEFGSPRAGQEPGLAGVIGTMERASKPVVAALHGLALGGGLELAMGCHYRIVAPGTRVALPEVKLGLLPGAGGTQRLPRAIGVGPALDLMVRGEQVAAEALVGIPEQKLFDQLARGADTVLDEAVALARSASRRHAAGAPLPRLRDLPCGHPQGDAYFQSARDAVRAANRNFPAPLQCVDAVESATREPFDVGLAHERERFVDLMRTPQSLALRHAFMAERSARKIPDVAPDTAQRTIAKVAVIGAGTMGGGIAMNFLNAGIPVVMLESSQQALDRGLATLRRNYEAQVGKGKLEPTRYAQRMALLTPTLGYADVADADLVIEAVFEDLGVKEQVFRQLDAVMKPGAILASNTSTLDLNTIAAFTRRPQDVVGMHFFSPANVMKLLEVVRGGGTGRDVLATVMAVGGRIGKICVVSGVCDGFIGNRMIEQYTRQAGFLIDEGCTPDQVDKAIEAFGFAMGPFRMGDLAGNDIGWAIRKRRAIEKPGVRFSKTADLLCAMGRFGQKTGAGWYDYAPGKRDAVPSRLVLDMIERHRAELGLTPRPIDDEEIVQRLVYALVNEAARILDEKIASRPSDIDMVYLAGYGFPLHRGGPLHYADGVGLSNVAKAMERFAQNPHDDAGFWQPAPLLRRLLAGHATFASLND